MRRIVLWWLVLTPLWIAFSFYASTSKIAFIPPALVVIALVLHWLHRHFVVAVAGEPEPRARPVRPNLWSRRGLQTPAVAAPAVATPAVTTPAAGAPSGGLFRPALIAVAVGACFGGAVMAFFHLNRPVSSYSAAAHATHNAGAQTEAVKTQTLAVEPNAAPTEAITSQSLAADPEMQDSSTVSPAHNADGKRAEAQITASDQTSLHQPRCNVSLCESSYQSFRASDCTYQPYSGPRQYCAR
jgi:4-amino-4-deoxy-L-arabinose transferase-like glycosyltransferase